MTPSSSTTFPQKLGLTLRMIKFQHSIFALPFALSMTLYATQGRPRILDILWIVLCMVTARNAAMSFNRIIDRKFDAQNPRTQNREIPSGKLSLGFSIGFCIVNCILFIYFSSFFNYLTTILSPFTLIIILGYSWTKRLTHGTQIFLGLSLGLAPMAAWIAMTGTLSIFSICIAIGVFFWVAGFDLIYSTLDYEHDKTHNLKNLVVKLGIAKSLFLARIFHIMSLGFFVLGGLYWPVSFFYFTGIILVALLLVYEHSLVSPHDLSRVNAAFFTVNGFVSMIFLATTILDLWH